MTIVLGTSLKRVKKLQYVNYLPSTSWITSNPKNLTAFLTNIFAPTRRLPQRLASPVLLFPATLRNILPIFVRARERNMSSECIRSISSRAVRPVKLRSLWLAPCRTSISTIRTLPERAARCKGVSREWSFASGLQFALANKSLTAAGCSFWQAKCNGVRPSDLVGKFTWAPASSSSWNINILIKKIHALGNNLATDKT